MQDSAPRFFFTLQGFGGPNQAPLDEVSPPDLKMAQALRTVFKQLSEGRTAPGATNINHIHVGGNAQKNLLFDVGGNPWVVLGVVNGHMDKSASPSVKAQESRVCSRQASKRDAEEFKLIGIRLTEV